jgi:hypothetical protein
MTENEHRLLELLAASEDGATEALVLASNFTLDTMVRLVRARLMTVKPERTFGGGKPVEVT